MQGYPTRSGGAGSLLRRADGEAESCCLAVVCELGGAGTLVWELVGEGAEVAEMHPERQDSGEEKELGLLVSRSIFPRAAHNHSLLRQEMFQHTSVLGRDRIR